jgi:cytidine deaminase
MDDRELMQRAIEARELSYSPYSKFAVGAALLCADGTVFTGANIENAAFGPSVCAERVAMFKAISEGNRSFVKLAVTCEGDHCRPCGVCRQVMFEHAPDMEVLMGNPEGEYVRTTVRELLPDGFTLHGREAS